MKCLFRLVSLIIAIQLIGCNRMLVNSDLNDSSIVRHFQSMQNILTVSDTSSAGQKSIFATGYAVRHIIMDINNNRLF
jgi:hypothetical protein